MITVFDDKEKIYTSFDKTDGKPCIAYANTRLEAERFCFELIQKNRSQSLGETE
jgi:hypothetical protein|tara:strand:+ start:619 stop:780 length:162 start_codon:yes stop_codon:yes gene_type:complete